MSDEKKPKVTKVEVESTKYNIETLKSLLGPWDGDILEVYSDGTPMTVEEAQAFVAKKKKEGVKV